MSSSSAEQAEQPSSSAAAAAALLAWAAAEGASVGRVTGGCSPLGGLGLFAATDVAAGEELLRCPLRLVLRASMALEDPVIGGPLTALRGELGERVVDDRLLLRLLLLHLHTQGAGGRFWPYFDALPPRAALVASLPSSWDPEQLRARLGGTALEAEAKADRELLERTHASVLRDGLCARWPAAFPPPRYGLEQLRWATAVFWSRAISLPVGSLAPLSRLHHRGGVEECLVPVLDLCNHRAGSVAALAVERAAPAAPAAPAAASAAAPAAAPAEACWVLRAGRAVAAGEEVLINYGAKGDGELLRAHGFVLGANPADVCPIDLAALLPAAASAAARAARLDACASRGLPTRAYLHHGGLPPALLPAAQLLCVPDAALPQLLELLDAQEARPFDWSACDWAAEDPFALAAAPPLTDGVQAEAEAAACEGLQALLRRALGAMGAPDPPPAIEAEPPLPPPPAGSDAECARAAAVYRRGQAALLREALAALAARGARTGGARGAAGPDQKKPRLI